MSRCKSSFPYMSHKVTYITSLFLTIVIFVVEILFGNLYHCIALVSDSFHVLTDLVSTAIGLFALIRSEHDRAKESKLNACYTYGFERYHIVGSMANGILLAAFSLTVIVESGIKFIDPEPMSHPKILLYIGIAGLIFNFLSLFMFHSHIRAHDSAADSLETFAQTSNDISSSIDMNSDENTPDKLVLFVNKVKPPKSALYINLKSVMLHIIGDVFGSLLVIIVSIFEIFYGNYKITHYLDPTLSIILAIVMMITSIRQLRHSLPILLQKVPMDYQSSTIKAEIIKKIAKIRGIHDFHLWHFASSIFIATLHVTIDSYDIFNEVHPMIYNILKKYGFHSITIQPELALDTPPKELSSNTNDYCRNSIDDNSIIFTCCPHYYRKRSE